MTDMPAPRLNPAELGYEDARTDLLESVSPVDYMDEAPMFMRRQRVTDYLTHIKLFEMSLEVMGSVVECGVYRGGSLMLYGHLSSILEPYALNRKVYGFDTFEGFASVGEHDGDVSNGGLPDSDEVLLQHCIELQDMNRALGHIPMVEIIKGDACETIPKFVEAHPELIISLLILDMDIYEPTVTAIDCLVPLVPKGGIVAFDELNEAKWTGETVALKRRMQMNDIRLRKFPWEHRLSYFVMGD